TLDGDATGHQAAPAVSWNGDSYLVAWQELRSGSWDIVGTRVDRTGVVLGDTFVISDAIDDQIEPAIAYDGMGHFVVWADDRVGGGGYDIYGARVDVTGVVADPTGVAISTAEKQQRGPSVAYDGDNWLVAWTDGRNAADIYAARVDGNVLLDPAGIEISKTNADDRKVDVARGGTWTYIVWERLMPSNVWQLHGTAIKSDGNVHTLHGVSLAGTSPTQEDPAVASAGTDAFVVAWKESGRIRARIHSFDGTALSSTASVGSGALVERDPDIAYDGATYMVAWQDGNNVNARGFPTVDPEFAISANAALEDQPALAAAEVGMLLTAYRTTGGSTRVRTRTLGNGCCDATGTGAGCLDPEVEACVCDDDPYCCDTEWDTLCVDEVESLNCGAC
ncbi:MAG TPA: hypothetical protein VG755_05760, partial [Nannocystaceae bacterium]|nr:hypothetical protein [Nannocystaceae bacterium]